jgi:hypothetical protein
MLCHVSRLTFKNSVATVLMALLASLAVGAGCLAASARNRPFVPDPDADQAPVLQGSTWVTEGPSYALRLQRLSEAERLAYLEKVTGVQIDPFASPPDRETRFMSFLLHIENRGESALEMNPIHCWLKTNKGELQTPLGLNDLGFFYRVAGGNLPPAYVRVQPALLESTRTIYPGDSIHGLLIYRELESNNKNFRVDVQLSLPNGETERFSAPYRRLKKGE